MGWARDCPEDGDFSGVEAMASDLGRVVDWLTLVAVGLRTGARDMPFVWSGPACEAWCDTAVRLADAATLKAEEVGDVERAARTYLETVPGFLVPEVRALKVVRAQARADLAAAARLLAAEQLVAAAQPDSRVTFTSPQTARIQDLTWLVGHCDERIESWAVEREGADARFAAAARGADLSLGSLLSELGLDLPFDQRYADLGVPVPVTFLGGFGQGFGAAETTVSVPGWWLYTDFDGVDPAEVAARWGQLDPLQRRALTESYPDRIGNLDGVPFTARDTANRKVLDRLLDGLDRARAEAHDLYGEPSRPEDHIEERARKAAGLTAEEVAALENLRAALGKYGAAQLVVLDLEHEGATRAALSLGNLDTASYVGVYVPGISTRISGTGFAGGMEEMAALRRETGRLLERASEGSASDVAQVFWLDYSAPAGLGPSVGPALRANRAEDGGNSLAGFGDGLAAVNPDARKTVQAHSSGSVTSTYGLARTDAFDAFVAFGSPGLPEEAEVDPSAARSRESGRVTFRDGKDGHLATPAPEPSTSASPAAAQDEIPDDTTRDRRTNPYRHPPQPGST